MLSLTVWAWQRHKAVGEKRLTHLLNERITKVFVEQPLALPGSANELKSSGATESRGFGQRTGNLQ